MVIHNNTSYSTFCFQSLDSDGPSSTSTGTGLLYEKIMKDLVLENIFMVLKSTRMMKTQLHILTIKWNLSVIT